MGGRSPGCSGRAASRAGPRKETGLARRESIGSVSSVWADPAPVPGRGQAVWIRVAAWPSQVMRSVSGGSRKTSAARWWTGGGTFALPRWLNGRARSHRALLINGASRGTSQRLVKPP